MFINKIVRISYLLKRISKFGSDAYVASGLYYKKSFTMKRNLLIALILAGIVTGLSGQDRIITRNNDTIDCRIDRVSRSEIHFELLTHGVRTTGRLPITEVLSYSVSPSTLPEQEYKPLETWLAGTLRIGLNGGMGYLTGNSEAAEEAMAGLGLASSAARDYYNNLKYGWYGGADAIWLFKGRYGAGLKYKFFYTGAATEGNFIPYEQNYIYYSEYRENIYVNYGGVSLFYSEPVGAKAKFSLYSGISAGITHYRNEMEILAESLLITGNAPGVDVTIGFDCEITPFLSAGAEASVFGSRLKKINLTNGLEEQTQELDKENYEDLSRLEVSVGIRFKLWNR